MTSVAYSRPLKHSEHTSPHTALTKELNFVHGRISLLAAANFFGGRVACAVIPRIHEFIEKPERASQIPDMRRSARSRLRPPSAAARSRHVGRSRRRKRWRAETHSQRDRPEASDDRGVDGRGDARRRSDPRGRRGLQAEYDRWLTEYGDRGARRQLAPELDDPARDRADRRRPFPARVGFVVGDDRRGADEPAAAKL